MARLAFNSAVNSSPGLRSQMSTSGDSDAENMGDPLVSQTEFATQVPYSPPKPLETDSTRKLQLLGTRKVMGDLRQLVNDSNRTPTKNKPYTDDKGLVDFVPSMQTNVERGVVTSTVIKSAMKIDGSAKGQDMRSSVSDSPRSSKQNAYMQDLDIVKDAITNRQLSPSRPANNIISETSVLCSNCHLDSFARWRDWLTKTTYLPRHLQTISKAQNDILLTDDKWQPALVGRPTRPGTLPLELLNSFTAAADQKATLTSELVQPNQKLSASLQEISHTEATSIDEELNLPPNSPILKSLTHTKDQSHHEAQLPEFEIEASSVEWSPSPPRVSPLRLMLPPDSSPLQVPLNMQINSPPMEGSSYLIKKSADLVEPSFVELTQTRDEEELIRDSSHHSDNPEGSVYTHVTMVETSNSLQEKSASKPLTAAAGSSTSQAELKSASCSNTKSPSVGRASVHIPIISSQDDLTKGLEINDISITHSDRTHTARLPTSNAPQLHFRQPSKYSLKTPQTQPASQQCPPYLSHQRIPRTLLQEIVDPQLTRSLEDLHQLKFSRRDFELESSEDGNLHHGDTDKSLSGHEVQNALSDSQQVIAKIQRASQDICLAAGNLQSADNGAMAHLDPIYSITGVLSEDKSTVSSASTSWTKRKSENPGNGRLSKRLKRADPMDANSLVSFSSEEPDFRRVDKITRKYRHEVFSSLKKKDNATTPWPPSSVVTFNDSSQSESVQSSIRQSSAQTSGLRAITVSTPQKSLLAQSQRVSRERSVSTSDMSRGRSLQPEGNFLVFRESYPAYRGDITQFLMSCRMIKRMRAAGKMLPQGVWDDFVYRHHHDYRPYLLGISRSNELESAMSYEEYYADCVLEPVHLKGILRLAFIDALSVDMDPVTGLDAIPLRTAYESDHLKVHRVSITASSSASNVKPNESPPARSDKVTAEDDSMTFKSRLQLKEQEEVRQNQPSSVHLWLQKGSGASSPDLGTPDRLVTPTEIPFVDLTQPDDDNLTFDLARELQSLTRQYVNTEIGAPRASTEESRLPHPETEPFKHFSLSHAKLDFDRYGGLQVQTDANGALRPKGRRIIDISTWRVKETFLLDKM